MKSGRSGCRAIWTVSHVGFVNAFSGFSATAFTLARAGAFAFLAGAFF